MLRRTNVLIFLALFRKTRSFPVDLRLPLDDIIQLLLQKGNTAKIVIVPKKVTSFYYSK